MTDNEVIKMFSDNFKRLRKENKFLQKDVARKLEVSTSIVSDWENGVKMPRGGMYQKIAELFGIHQKELFIEKGSPYNALEETIRLPIVGKISCGNGSMIYEEIEGYETTPKDWATGGDFFYLRAKGDSMIGARIFDGDLLLIRKQPEVEDGEIAAVLIDDESVLKKVYFRDGTIILQSENQAYPPLMYSLKDKNVKIIGKLKKNVIDY